MTYGVGILGAGMIATANVGVLPGMRRLSGRASVQAIASRSRGRAEAAAETFGIPRVCDSLDELLADDSVGIVVNLTSIEAHYETSLKILRAGRHLVSEKPLAATSRQADGLLAAAASTGREIVVASPRMVEPSRIRAAALVRDGALGQTSIVRARVSHAGPGGMRWPANPRPFYMAGAGPLRDLGPYAIEQIAGVVAPIVRVTSLSRRSRDEFAAYGDGPFGGVAVRVEVPDTVVLACELRDGGLALIDCAYGPVQASSPQLEVFGLEGSLELYSGPRHDCPRLRVHRRGVSEPGEWSAGDTADDRARQREIDALGRAVLVEHLLDVLDGRSANFLSARAARHVVAVIEAAEVSAQTGRVQAVAPEVFTTPPKPGTAL